jgi:hypothetical protein
MPSKALLHPGQALYQIRHVPGAREAADGQLGVQAVFDNRDSIISDLDDSAQVPWLDDNDISLYRDHGRVTGERRVVVGDATGQQRLSQAPAPNRRVRERPFPDTRPRRTHTRSARRARGDDSRDAFRGVSKDERLEQPHDCIREPASATAPAAALSQWTTSDSAD